uniref:Uncharacterized protein n=1 Tax=Romanomermis culicivorax TaxID=13658 RepID=A0A915HX71_ROMCU
MTPTVKKPNNLTLQAVIAANTNAVMMHCSIEPKANKRARCTQPVSTKTRTGIVSADHHRKTSGCFEKSAGSGVQGSVTAASSDGCGGSRIICNIASAHGHGTTAYCSYIPPRPIP